VDYVFSLTLFNPVGCDLALLFLPTTALHLFFQIKTTLHISCSTLFRFCSTFVGDGMVWSPPRSPLPCGPRRRSIRHFRGEHGQKHHFFRESRFWCFEGSWERKSRSLGVQTHPSHFSRPSKFTAGRCAATSPRCPVSLLANYLCVLASLHPTHLIEARKPHQDGRRRTTAHCVFSASTATPKSCV